MEWSPEANAAIDKAPPFVRKMARKAVERVAKKKGIAVVTREIVDEARQTMMGHTSRPSENLNKGIGSRESMHLTDESRCLANTSGDALHDAFDRKLAVHAMARNTPMAADEPPRVWRDTMTALPADHPRRCLYIHIPFCHTHCLFCGFYQNLATQRATGQYVETLLMEMESTASLPFVQDAPFQAVYFCRYKSKPKLTYESDASGNRAAITGTGKAVPMGAFDGGPDRAMAAGFFS